MSITIGFRFFWICAFILNLVFSQFDEFFYTGFDGVGNNMSLNGAAEIENNGIIRLTNRRSRILGHAFYTSPLQFKNSSHGTAFSFSTTFSFAIVPEYRKLGGHGLVFTISPTKELRGALPAPYLGLFNASHNGNFSNHVFAVEFDTVQDFEFEDINDNHIGIDINGLHSNASVRAPYFSDALAEQGIYFQSGKTIQAWIDYDSVNHFINVTISPFSSKPDFSLLSFPLDLSPILKDSMYVGFSASTGLLASAHYIFGWSFKMNGEARSLDLSALPSLCRPKKKQLALTIAVSTVLTGAVISMAVLYLFRKIKNADVIESWELEIGPHRFSYQELKLATKGFKDEELLGFGGFGRVYRGTLLNSETQVAVKRISNDSKQGLQEFVSEIATIGRLRHRNLVQLQGWCRRRNDFILVYEYMPNGSLDKFLFNEPKVTLSWEQRFKIIKGVASGLLYLHEGWEQVVIHRDVKASNVLIDTDFNGRLGDFGLARLYEHGANPTTTRVVGTLGYLAPELTRTGKSTTNSDVFAFGAVLLEVACGRKPIEAKALPEELILVDWVWDKWREERIFDVVDRRMKGEYDGEEMLMVLKLGILCSNCSPKVRPSMRQVVSYLEGEMRLPEILCPPGEYESGKNEEGFDDFLHLPASSSFGKVSSYSLVGNGDGDIEAPLVMEDEMQSARQ